MKTVIIADGVYPLHFRAVNIIEKADFLIACDGAADKLIAHGKMPNLIIGDLDSVSEEILAKYASITKKISRQDNTDLMKAIEWCIDKGIRKVSIVGATGGREDHTVGNLFSIIPYASSLYIKLYTDTGYFVALSNSKKIKTYKGQQVSLFPQPLSMKITTEGLRFPLKNEALQYIHSGLLNEAEGNAVCLEFAQGVLLVYRTYPQS